jgi:hypothetical protein
MNKYWIKKQNNLFVTDAAWYDKTNSDKARRLAEIAEKVLPAIREFLNLEEKDGYVVIGAIKARRTTGCWYPWMKEARVDYRSSSVKSFVETLAHELTHAQQYAQGRLKQERGVFSWNDQVAGKHPTSHAKYLALPWEVEAREKAKEIVAMLVQKGLITG